MECLRAYNGKQKDKPKPRKEDRTHETNGLRGSGPAACSVCHSLFRWGARQLPAIFFQRQFVRRALFQQPAGERSGGRSSETSTPTTEPQETASQPESAPSEESAPAGGILIAYFSWSGNTEAMAQMIQAETGGELFAIAPATPYTEDYNTLLDVAQQEQAEDARPELAAQVENWDSYDVVFVGYPDWWSDAPMVVYSFLEAYDWTGKTLVPFCTSGGSGFGRSLDRLSESAPGAAILEGLHVNGDSVEGAGEEVAAWIDGLGL